MVRNTVGADLVQAHIGGTEGFPLQVSIVIVAFLIREETIAFSPGDFFFNFQSHEQ